MDKPKMLVVGWDGATFDIIEPLIAQGRLPHIASLMREGSWGRLESTVPPLTPIAWTSLSTGVNPGKHGIYDAMIYSPAERKVRFVNATMRKATPVWSLLSEQGRKVCVMNVPVTYPPDRVEGIFVSGMFTPEGVSDFVQPPELLEEIEKKFGKYVIECNQSENPGEYLKAIMEVEVDYRERVATHLMSSYAWDYFFLVFMASDRVQHFYWKYLDPGHPEHKRYGDAIARVYEKMDQALGRLIAQAGPDAHVMIVSDHGAGPLTSAFFLNNWLMKMGYLHLLKNPFEEGKPRKRLLPLSAVLKFAKKYLPDSLLRAVKRRGSSRHETGLNFFYSLIDWDKTTAFSEGVAGGIFINRAVVGPDLYNSLIESLSEGLLNIRNPEGEKVIKAVHHRDGIYKGEFLPEAPDLIVICAEKYQIISPNEFFYHKKDIEDSMFLSHRWSGRHEQDGVFIVKGPHVRSSGELRNCRITDMAPMVLYLMDETIPAYMDGRVLEEAIDKVYLAEHPVQFASTAMEQEGERVTLSEEEEQLITEKLKSLGYME